MINQSNLAFNHGQRRSKSGHTGVVLFKADHHGSLQGKEIFENFNVSVNTHKHILVIMITSGGDASLLQSLGRRGSTQTKEAIPNATPFCSFGWNLLSSSRQDRSKEVREARTGVVFPGEFCLEKGQRVCPVLTGVG